MSLHDAINYVCIYLHRQQSVFTLYRAQAIADMQFRVSIHQVQPENTIRTFDVVPAEVADCWNVVEVAQ